MPSAFTDVQALFQAAVEHHKQGRLAEAEQLYRQILAAHPNHADALNLLGALASQAGRHDLAVELTGRAVGADASFAAYQINHGIALRGLGRLDDAERAFLTATRLDPRKAGAHAQRGGVLLAQGRTEAAAGAFRDAIRIQPHFPAAYSELGVALYELGRLDEALGAYREALRQDPRSAVVLTNLGNALAKLGRGQEAVDAFDRALAIQPNLAEAHCNRGHALKELKRIDEALQSFDRAIALKPDFAQAHLYLAMATLAVGDFETGLKRYEWRKALGGAAASRQYAQPEWTGGEDLKGRTLLIWAEQGLGDTLQFWRYVPMAAALGARVVVSVQDALLPLLDGQDPRIEVIGADRAPEAFDYHCALLSLPLAFGATPSSIPAAPAYLHAKPEAAAAWGRRLGEGGRPRVGLVWSGNAAHQNDHNRSVALAALAPLLSSDADWIGLQTEIRGSDEAALAAYPQLRMFAADLADFSQTAGLVANLDMIVAVDTSVAHLAAAMGKPTLILLPFSGDWRWGLEGEDSAWYPTARLLRQPAPGDWASVVESARARLTKPLSPGSED